MRYSLVNQRAKRSVDYPTKGDLKPKAIVHSRSMKILELTVEVMVMRVTAKLMAGAANKAGQYLPAVLGCGELS